MEAPVAIKQLLEAIESEIDCTGKKNQCTEEGLSCEGEKSTHSSRPH